MVFSELKQRVIDDLTETHSKETIEPVQKANSLPELALAIEALDIDGGWEYIVYSSIDDDPPSKRGGKR